MTVIDCGAVRVSNADAPFRYVEIHNGLKKFMLTLEDARKVSVALEKVVRENEEKLNGKNQS